MISDDENRVLEAVRQCGTLEAYRRLIAENNALIQGPDLNNGRAVTTMRTAIHTALAGQWTEEQQRTLGYDKPFAMVALGGTGRAEVTPCSDLDFALLFDDAIEGNAFLLELQRQMLHTSGFRERLGFSCIAFPFNRFLRVPVPD
jgi:signal-transduction protein with cAMP-binding, CBS, and nucleotidyltransferase domain